MLHLLAPPATADAPGTNSLSGPALLELDLEQLLQMRAGTVEGASRRQQLISEAPSAVTIITSEEIQKQGYRTLADALNSVPGLYVSNDRDFWYLGARGFSRPGDYNSRYLLLVDGHRVNNNIYDSAPVGPEFPLDLDLISRIEIIPGPGAALYGNNAFFGVINVITKKGRELHGAEAAASVSSHGAGQGRFTFGQVFTNSGVEFLLSGSYMDDPGPRTLTFTDPGGNQWTAHRRDFLQSVNLYGSLRYKEWSLNTAFSRTPNGLPAAPYESDRQDPRCEWEEQYGFVEVKWDHVFNDNHRLTTRGYFNRYTYSGTYPYLGQLYFDDVAGQQYGFESLWTAHLRDRHTLSLGAEVCHNFQMEQIYRDESGLSYLEDRRSNVKAAAFAQWEWSLRSNLRLNLGGRLDYHEWYDTQLSPRLALIYQPWKGTTLKALHGTAFRAPNVFEMFYGLDSNYQANTHLGPETITTHELVWEQKIARPLSLRVSGFYYAIDDLINQEMDPLSGDLMFHNLDRVNARGLEAAWEVRLQNGVRWRASYTFQRARSRGEDLENSPRHLVKNHLYLPLYKDRWWLAAESLYASECATGMSGVKANDYWLLNLTLWCRPLGKNLDYSASIYNLLGHKYAYPAGPEYWSNSGPLTEFHDRQFRLKMTYRF